MKHAYQIQGMTCKGCEKNINKALTDVKGVTKVQINFDASTVEIEMSEHIPIEHIETAIQRKNDKYHIHPAKPDGIITRTFPVNGMACKGN